jgi:hypothetical protein
VQAITDTRGADVVDMPQSPVRAEKLGGTAKAARSDAVMLVADPAAVHKLEASLSVQVAVQDANLSLPGVAGSGGNPDSSSERRVRKRDKLKKLLFH